MTEKQTELNQRLTRLVAQAIFDKFVEGDSYGFGTWEDFQDEAKAAIRAYEEFYAHQ